jgi:hypothetical protein
MHFSCGRKDSLRKNWKKKRRLLWRRRMRVVNSTDLLTQKFKYLIKYLMIHKFYKQEKYDIDDLNIKQITISE